MSGIVSGMFSLTIQESTPRPAAIPTAVPSAPMIRASATLPRSDAGDGDAVGEHRGVLAGALVGVDRGGVERDQQRHRAGDRDRDEQDLVELLHALVDGVGRGGGALDRGDARAGAAARP